MLTTRRVQGRLIAALIPMVLLTCVAAQPAVAQLSVPPAAIQSYEGDPGRLGRPGELAYP